ncbi:IS3 family transposase [Agromyces endophyticus]|uniref:IS3 family transposase n=1 Tax=Agromyces sp. H17E-10 TaxID=2932244 RepID=UPI001FD49A1E|nr:IS3 family transposase [Agromyces sp. H17E-10]UOQ89482.1 IS3 family transposase [Agromyces sp. H17E-10]
MPRQYPPEFRQRALRLLEESLPDHESEYEAIRQVSRKLGVSAEALRKWRRQSEVDSGTKPGVSTDQQAELRRLKREVAELRRANEILKSAAAFFRSGTRPPHDEMIRYVDMFKDQFGVEAICRTLGATACGFLTARGYRAAKARPASDRAIRDEILGEQIARLHAENYSVYGVRKMHALMRRQGWTVGRDQVGRIMRSLGLRGVKRGKRVFTTKPDPAAVMPKDLVKRRFTADGPRRLWVADITYVRTWQGFAYTAFVIDVYSRRIVGWNVAATLKAEILPLQALNMAAFQAGGDLDQLVHHADHGSNYLSLVYTDRIAELGAKASTGTVGDSYDNALAEAVNGLYKTELIRQQGPWRTVEQVELATLEWVWWWNNQRLHSELGYRAPVEVEAAHYAEIESPVLATASHGNR